MQGLLHWSHFPLRVSFGPLPQNIADPDASLQAVKAGFAQWTDATHGMVRFVVVPPSSQADVTVSFTSGSNVPGQGAAVGYTSMTFCGDCLRDADICLATGDAAPADLQTVAAHEFGHALGINGHSDDPADIMYPSTLRLSSQDGTSMLQPVHPITLRDLNTLKLCYADMLAPRLAAARPNNLTHGYGGAALLRAHHVICHSPRRFIPLH